MTSRTGRLTLTLLAAALLSACASVTAPTSAPMSAPTSTSASISATIGSTLPTSTPRLAPVSDAPHVLMPGVMQRVDRNYIDRYVCMNRQPLACECYSRLSEVCLCRC